MDLALWIGQGILAFVFLMAGAMKLIMDKATIVEKMGGWATDFKPSTLKAIGSLELAGAVGVLLPWITGTLPVLTPLAAIGLLMTMLGAMSVHLPRGETGNAMVNLFLGAVAAFVAFGRWMSINPPT